MPKDTTIFYLFLFCESGIRCTKLYLLEKESKMERFIKAS